MSRLQRSIKRNKLQDAHKNKYAGMGQNEQDKLTKFNSKKLPYSPLKPVGPSFASKFRKIRKKACYNKKKFNKEGACKLATKLNQVAKQCPFCNDWHLHMPDKE